jgi:DNA modification methylase
MTDNEKNNISMDELLTAAVHYTPKGLMKLWLNQIHCGDCIEIMNKMPVGSIDLIVTSPPYNLRNSTGNGMKDGRGGKW